jgi:hypothetical protein
MPAREETGSGALRISLLLIPFFNAPSWLLAPSVGVEAPQLWGMKMICLLSKSDDFSPEKL